MNEAGRARDSRTKEDAGARAICQKQLLSPESLLLGQHGGSESGQHRIAGERNHRGNAVCNGDVANAGFEVMNENKRR